LSFPVRARPCAGSGRARPLTLRFPTARPRASRSNPLPLDALLMDETSMLNVTVAAALMRALRSTQPDDSDAFEAWAADGGDRNKSMRIVLVGDADQLPPVGPGLVLRAAIEAGRVPVVDLRRIFRQAADSAIVQGANRLNSGERPAFQEWLAMTGPGSKSPQWQARALRALRAAAADHLPRRSAT